MYYSLTFLFDKTFNFLSALYRFYSNPEYLISINLPYNWSGMLWGSSIEFVIPFNNFLKL